MLNKVKSTGMDYPCGQKKANLKLTSLVFSISIHTISVAIEANKTGHLNKRLYLA